LTIVFGTSVLVGPLPFLLWSAHACECDNKQKWAMVGAFYGVGLIPSSMAFVSLIILAQSLTSIDPYLREREVLRMFVNGSVLFGFLIANTGIATAKPFSFSWARISYYIPLFIYIFLTFTFISGWDFIPKSFMYIYKFGNIRDTSLVLNESGCTIAKAHRLIDSFDEICVLPHMIIHSRLGSTYYVEVDDKSSTPQTTHPVNARNSMRFILPAANVLSWSVAVPKNPTVAGAPQNTQNPTSPTELPQSYNSNQTQ
jgi:hypothetical protein